jgi:hypothetical protein
MGEEEVDEIAKALVKVITWIDYWRPSWKKLSSGLFSDWNSIYYYIEKLVEYDPAFMNEIDSWLESHHNKVFSFPFIKPKSSPPPPLGLLYIVWPFLAFSIKYSIIAIVFMSLLFLFFTFEIIFFVPLFDEPIIGHALSIGFPMVIIVMMSLLLMINRKNKIGKLNESEIFEQNQRLINYAIDLFSEKNIDPKKFPFRLAYNDYNGLTYKKEFGRYSCVIG